MMKGGIGNILKQAQAMQENMRKAQEELATIEVTGSSGGGLVSLVMTCRHDVKRVTIDPSLLKDDAAQGSASAAGDRMSEAAKEVLEDLVAAAMNDAVRKAELTTQQKMSGLTAGLNIPGLTLPF
ncbi:MAG: nucleoid-associated protein, YbaB/EbfC family [Candidatus Muproteobacteria bacterium RBG_16_62_13]|uniref:Nucleoid-associated protein A2140_08470 n=1 Tax=Candidatus Muproteobacteria bacterium RBG_16_62_13 TaxID=1817756 RepID=A0A1F6T3K0_9PROT|nr:MAG: nucleoid-associated protein, YbaB/EbfC family [Candidatus Muproteobacteria bacterium RBG_16_62_13]